VPEGDTGGRVEDVRPRGVDGQRERHAQLNRMIARQPGDEARPVACRHPLLDARAGRRPSVELEHGEHGRAGELGRDDHAAEPDDVGVVDACGVLDVLGTPR
jgi:hypothetical protein